MEIRFIKKISHRLIFKKRVLRGRQLPVRDLGLAQKRGAVGKEAPVKRLGAGQIADLFLFDILEGGEIF